MNEHQVQTAIRKLHLEPNDILVITDYSLKPEAFAEFHCGHSTDECKGHIIVVAPDGVETLNRDMLTDLLKRLPEEQTVKLQ